MASHAHDAHDAHDAHHGPHVTPLPVYFGVFGALLVLTFITVWITRFDFGAADTVVAMAVATVKAVLVAAVFMHLLHDDRLNTLAFVFGLLFVALFFIFTLLDVFTRKHVDPIRANNSIAAADVDKLRLEVEKARGAKPAPIYVDEAAVPEGERSVVKPAAPAVPASEAPSVQINYLTRGQRTVITGNVNSDATLQGVLGAARGVVGDKNVVSRLTMDSTLPAAAWVDEANAAFGTLKGVRGLSMQASPKGLVVDGRVDTNKIKTDTSAALAAAVKSLPVTNRLRVKPAGDEALDRFALIEKSAAGKNLYFADKAAELGETAKPVLAQVSDLLFEIPAVNVEVGAHAEPNSGEDKALTQKRADAIKAWLVGQGIAPERITAKGYGASKPVKGAAGQSRRVEYSVLDAAGKLYERLMLVEMMGDKIAIYKKIYFNTGKDSIKANSLKVLDKVAETFQAQPQVTLVEIQGHTDSSGNADKNKALSQKRAESVRRYLMKKGIAGDRLTAVGYGSLKPIESNETLQGREANRRVEFKILKQ